MNGNRDHHPMHLYCLIRNQSNIKAAAPSFSLFITHDAKAAYHQRNEFLSVHPIIKINHHLKSTIFLHKTFHSTLLHHPSQPLPVNPFLVPLPIVNPSRRKRNQKQRVSNSIVLLALSSFVNIVHFHAWELECEWWGSVYVKDRCVFVY